MLSKTITMSSSSGQKSSNFAQTCNLLSQFLKEKGSFGDFSLGISAAKHEASKGVETCRQQPATTMNLLPNLENVSAETLKQSVGAPSSSSSVNASDFFSGISRFGSSSNLMEDADNKADDLRKPVATMEHGTSKMTIFYAGKVLVFNDFPAEKAKEIMALAEKAAGSSMNTSSSPGFVANATVDKVNSCRAVTPDLNITSSTSGTTNMTTKERLIQQLKPPQPIVSDLPIARRASLHRFFEKRKDRVIARAPYQVNGSPVTPPKPEESKKPWLELEAQLYKQLDLKL